jgi:hypothetical protein
LRELFFDSFEDMSEIKPLPRLKKLFVFGRCLPTHLLRAARNLIELGIENDLVFGSPPLAGFEWTDLHSPGLLSDLLPSLIVLHIRDEAMEHIPAFLVPLPPRVQLLNMSGCKRLKTLPPGGTFGALNMTINVAGCPCLVLDRDFQ